GAQDAELAVDRVRARQERPGRLPPQHVEAGGGIELVGRVRLPAAEAFGGKRTPEPLDMVAQPSIEPVEREVVVRRCHCGETEGRRSNLEGIEAQSGRDCFASLAMTITITRT